MEKFDYLFIEPFEITQFWSSTEFSIHSRHPEKLHAELVVNHPKDGVWYIQISHGVGTPFIGDYLQPFMPTRANIYALHKGLGEMSKLLHDAATVENFKLPSESVFAAMVPYHGVVSRNLRDQGYQNALWRVLAQDWGITLPLPRHIGQKAVVFTHNDGLPCAAAMEAAVEPIIAALKGPIKKIKQSLVHEDPKTLDVVDYRLADGSTLTQRFDISALFGKKLRNVQFEFTSPVDTLRSSPQSGSSQEKPTSSPPRPGSLLTWFINKIKGSRARDRDAFSALVASQGKYYYLMDYRKEYSAILGEVTCVESSLAELFIFRFWLTQCAYRLCKPDAITDDYVIAAVVHNGLNLGAKMFERLNDVDIEEILGEELPEIIDSRFEYYDRSFISGKTDLDPLSIEEITLTLAFEIMKRPSSSGFAHLRKKVHDQFSEITTAFALTPSS